MPMGEVLLHFWWVDSLSHLRAGLVPLVWAVLGSTLGRDMEVLRVVGVGPTKTGIPWWWDHPGCSHWKVFMQRKTFSLKWEDGFPPSEREVLWNWGVQTSASPVSPFQISRSHAFLHRSPCLSIRDWGSRPLIGPATLQHTQYSTGFLAMLALQR